MTERSLAGTQEQLIVALCGPWNPDEADGRGMSESEKIERMNERRERSTELETGEREVGGVGLTITPFG